MKYLILLLTFLSFNLYQGQLNTKKTQINNHFSTKIPIPNKLVFRLEKNRGDTTVKMYSIKNRGRHIFTMAFSSEEEIMTNKQLSEFSEEDIMKIKKGIAKKTLSNLIEGASVMYKENDYIKNSNGIDMFYSYIKRATTKGVQGNFHYFIIIHKKHLFMIMFQYLDGDIDSETAGNIISVVMDSISYKD